MRFRRFERSANVAYRLKFVQDGVRLGVLSRVGAEMVVPEERDRELHPRDQRRNVPNTDQPNIREHRLRPATVVVGLRRAVKHDLLRESHQGFAVARIPKLAGSFATRSTYPSGLTVRCLTCSAKLKSACDGAKMAL